MKLKSPWMLIFLVFILGCATGQPNKEKQSEWIEVDEELTCFERIETENGTQFVYKEEIK